MAKAGWGSHEDMPVAISLDAIGDFGEAWIPEDLGPTRQVKPGLRGEIWKLDGDRHEGMIRRKRNDCIDSRRILLRIIREKHQSFATSSSPGVKTKPGCCETGRRNFQSAVKSHS